MPSAPAADKRMTSHYTPSSSFDRRLRLRLGRRRRCRRPLLPPCLSLRLVWSSLLLLILSSLLLTVSADILCDYTHTHTLKHANTHCNAYHRGISYI